MSTSVDDRESGDEELCNAVCQRLVADFVERTETNEALAQMFLQENNWNVARAVGVFFDETGGKDLQQNVLDTRSSKLSDMSSCGLETGNCSGTDSMKNSLVRKSAIGKSPAPVVTLEDSSDDDEKVPTMLPKIVSEGVIFITYNIDGICEKNRDLRTRAVCKMILDTKADIVFLQEVVPSTAKILKEQLETAYEIISGQGYKGFPSDYFTHSLFRKETATVNSHEVIDYELSVMTRNMLTANITINGVTLNLVNTHLESTKDFKDHRMKQFEDCYYKFIAKCPLVEPVILAGDLNMRDKELADAGGLPPGLIDAWIATGKKKECEFTWDMMRNDNLDANFGKFKPRCRFDRILLRDSKPSKMIPATFNLIGIERLKPYVCFPSDHWGLLCVFKTS